MTSNPYNYSANWTAKWAVQVACGSSASSPCSYTILTGGQTYTPNYNDQCTAINAANITGANISNINCGQNTVLPSTSPSPYGQFYNIMFYPTSNTITLTKDASFNSIINFVDISTTYTYSFPIALKIIGSNPPSQKLSADFSLNPFSIYPLINPTTNDPNSPNTALSNNGFSIITATPSSLAPFTYFTINPGTYDVSINCLTTVNRITFSNPTPAPPTLPTQIDGYSQIGNDS